MRSIEWFLILYACIAFMTVFSLDLLGVYEIDIYAAGLAAGFFVASELASPFAPRESRRRTIAGILLLAVFTGIVTQRLLELLGLSG